MASLMVLPFSLTWSSLDLSIFPIDIAEWSSQVVADKSPIHKVIYPTSPVGTVMTIY